MAKRTRRELELEMRKTYVLEATEELFAHGGYAGTTMKAAARRAELALATLYRLFRSKRELYAELLQMRCGQLADRIRAAISPEEDVVSRVERFIEAKMTYLHANWRFAKLYLKHRHTPAEEADPQQRSAFGKYRQALDELVADIRKGVAGRRLKSVCPERLAAALDGVTSELVGRWLEVGRPESPEEDIELAKDMILKGVVREKPGQA